MHPKDYHPYRPVPHARVLHAVQDVPEHLDETIAQWAAGYPNPVLGATPVVEEAPTEDPFH